MTNDGIIGVYRLTNTADAGYMPVMQLVKLFDAFFSRQRVGVTRLYAALGANAQVDAVFRLWNTRIDDAMPKDLFAVLSPSGGLVAGDSVQYRITLAQDVTEQDAVDITVERLDKFYDIAPDQT